MYHFGCKCASINLLMGFEILRISPDFYIKMNGLHKLFLCLRVALLAIPWRDYPQAHLKTFTWRKLFEIERRSQSGHFFKIFIKGWFWIKPCTISNRKHIYVKFVCCITLYFIFYIQYSVFIYVRIEWFACIIVYFTFGYWFQLPIVDWKRFIFAL